MACATSIDTVVPYNISNTSAWSGGINIFANEAITEKGVAYSTSPNPTIAGDNTSDGTTSTPFDSEITPLLPDTTYYVRAFATAGCGTVYGQEWSFKTSAQAFSLNQCDTSEIEVLPGETYVIPEGSEIVGIVGLEDIESTCVDKDKLEDIEEPQCYGFMFGIPKKEDQLITPATQWGEKDQTRVIGLKVNGHTYLLADEIESDDGGNIPFTTLDDLAELYSPDDINWKEMCEIDNTDGGREWFLLFEAKPSFVNKIKLLITMSSPGLTAIQYDLVPYSRIKILSLGYDIECDCDV